MGVFLLKSDYEEQQCLLNMHPETKTIPIGRIIEKLDAYLERNDYAAADRHLAYWLSEAESVHDLRGKLTLLNEQIGLFRKTEQEPECLQTVTEVLALAEKLDITDTVTYGTTLVNAATGYNAFGRVEEALALYRKALALYEDHLTQDDERLGGLYNNMALALAELGEYREAEELYQKAIEVMQRQEYGAPEIAITYLNLADLVLFEAGAAAGAEKIGMYLQRAEAFLDREDLPKNARYAFVCEKCAPVFGAYGYSQTEEKLKRRAREIYEGS